MFGIAAVAVTEETIERAAERSMDALDRRFMEARSGMTQAAYDAQVKAIDNWARDALRSLRMTKAGV